MTFRSQKDIVGFFETDEYPITINIVLKISSLMTISFLSPNRLTSLVESLSFVEQLPYFSTILLFLASICTLLIWTNTSLRTASLSMALIVLIGVFCTGYSNNKFYLSCIFFLAGITNRENFNFIFRAQFFLVYFFAGMDKILNVEWRSGYVLEHLGAGKPFFDIVLNLGFTFRNLSWGIIIFELLFPFLFFSKNFDKFVLPVGVLFHISLSAGNNFHNYSHFTVLGLCTYLLFSDYKFFKCSHDKISFFTTLKNLLNILHYWKAAKNPFILLLLFFVSEYVSFKLFVFIIFLGTFSYVMDSLKYFKKIKLN